MLSISNRLSVIYCNTPPIFRPRRIALPAALFLLALAFSAPARAASSDTHTFGNPDLWQWPPTRAYHVENYKLKLHFDEPHGEIFGDELVTLRPFAAHFRKFYFDCSGLNIDSVSLQSPSAAPLSLSFSLEDPRLWITLDRDYDPSAALQLRIVYHGFPRTGLFFVNPDSSYPRRPREIWTQGEPEFNHFWFPCWDYPNDMATSETITTVPLGQSVVSNGKLLSVTRSSGQVSYDWMESVPHSSYLVSLAVGPWRKFSDMYHGKPVEYFVPDYVDEATARRSFHLTPDMLAFFSLSTGVDYPFEKYAQTTVHNFIFGGQENVSATTLTEFTLHDQRADQDYPSTGLVSHELGQHWFGDYVQGGDWADIWLNEGFATYLSALYTQHHEGYDAYRFEIYNDQLAEQSQERNDYLRPIVDLHFAYPMQMFDSITHEKGAAVLDMLRYLLDGPQAASHPASQSEPLFQALHYYLVAHHAQTAHTSDLIQAIRRTTGQELGWFFREWVFMAGHPDYHVEADYDASSKIERVVVTQTQHIDAATPVFDMPIDLAFYGSNAQHLQIQVRDHLQRQEFDIPLDFAPQWVDFDPQGFIDKTLHFDQPLASLAAQSANDPSMMSRLWAVQQLGTAPSSDSDARVAALVRVLSTDSFYAVRAAAAASLGNLATPQSKSALLSALLQPDSRVRSAVVAALGKFPSDPAVYNAFVNALRNDPSYAVQAAAARQLGKSRLPQAFDVLQSEAAARPEVHVMQATLDGLAATGDPRAPAILLAQSQPGVPERIRLAALSDLANLAGLLPRDRSPELIQVVQSALHDPFLPVRETGEQIAGAFALVQFRPYVQSQADSAPTADERDTARQILEHFHP
ncbi:MAG TPA: M1 family aminopeptidase [Verrucomicrobiae bacterium]|nr:M1 family aminopeptidase [Verrucomicrobiae bacterium]